MAFATPQYPTELVDAAGDALAGYANTRGVLGHLDPAEVINNWRSSDVYPLNTFQMTLRNRHRRIGGDGIVAQRIKRLSSIRSKLERYEHLKLSQIQDIAGCRVIVPTVPRVLRLVKGYKEGYSDHILDDESDYISSPKRSGYRSYHLIFRYKGEAHWEYDDLKIEMQFRSELQHCWATAVETVDVFHGESLKAGQGTSDWRRFFALMASAIARREKCRRIPRTPSDERELVAEIRALATQLDVVTSLQAYGKTLNTIGRGDVEAKGIKYVILVLDPKENKTTLYGYRQRDLDHATARYAALEKAASAGSDAVLVSVADAKTLRRAYPNYFLDTSVFVREVKRVVAS